MIKIKANIDFLKACITEHDGSATLLFYCPGDIGLKELDSDECSCDYRTCRRCWRKALEKAERGEN